MPVKITRLNREKIAFAAAVLNVTLTLLIAFFGYLISKDVRDIQKHADQRAEAKELQEFWGDMRVASQNLDEQSRHFSESLVKFTIASNQLIDEYDRIYQSGHLDRFDYDLKYLAAYAGFLSAYGEVSAAVASVWNEYAFLRVRYAAMAATHKVSGWKEFASQDKDITAWTAEVKTQINGIFSGINSAVTERKDPSPVVNVSTATFYKLGKFLATKPIPYAKGLELFLDANSNAQSVVITGS